jgi:N-acetylglucosamine kinase-like BadF-type ATPase
MTSGINPVYHSNDVISEMIFKFLVPVTGQEVDKLFFYGAGVVSQAMKDKLKTVFSAIFPAAEVLVDSDVLGAARACCGHNAGIACIIGTGSNSCLFDGSHVVKNVAAGGFILGDEASGAYLGVKLVSDFIKGMLPADLSDAFVKKYNVDYSQIVENVYRKPSPNRYLSGFALFIQEHREHPYIKSLIKRSFEAFFDRNVLQYEYDKYTVNFVGSIAYIYRDVLKEVAESRKCTVGNIIQAPAQGLVEYHRADMNRFSI